MEKSEMIQVCKQCKKKGFDPSKGIVCSLTLDSPNFQDKCESFEGDSNAEKIIIKNRITKTELNESVKRITSSANWFYWIAALSVINSVMIYAETDRSFIIGLGITQIVDGFILMLDGSVKIIGILFNLCLAGVFGMFGYYAGKFRMWAFIVGLVLYLLDSLIFLLVQSWASFGFHVFAFVMIAIGAVKLYELNQKKNKEESGEVSV